MAKSQITLAAKTLAQAKKVRLIRITHPPNEKRVWVCYSSQLHRAEHDVPVYQPTFY